MADLRDPDLTQKIRVLDVVAIGPLMIYGGMKAKDLPGWARAGLVLFGVTTIGYNASNYMSRREEVRRNLVLKALEEGEDV
jgi:hypothetical protein